MQILEELELWGTLITQGDAWHSFEDRYQWSRQRYNTTLDQFMLLIDPNGTVVYKNTTEN